MKYKFRHLVLLFVFGMVFSLILGCEQLNFLNPKKSEEPKKDKIVSASVVTGTVIARVNNFPITLEELNKYIDIFNASIELRQDLTPEQKKEAKIETREKKIDYLRNFLVRQRVFCQAALDRGIDRRSDVVDILEKNKIAVLAQEMQNEVIKNIDVSSTEIEEAYNRTKNFFKEPESRKIREIVTRTEEEARQVLREALDPSVDFGSLARSRSVSASAKNGGDLGYIKIGERGETYSVFDEVVFSPALREGSISSTFKGPEGYYVVKIEAVKEGKQLSLSEVWDTLRQLLLQSRQAEELEKFYAKLARDEKIKIEIYEQEIK